MRTFGKVILGLIFVFIGITIFNYANTYGVHKSVGEQGDKAYIEDDLSFFKNRFEYHLDTPILYEDVSFLIDEEYLEKHNIEEVVDKTVSFTLYMFHSANVSNQAGNYLTVLVKDLVLPEEIKKEDFLSVYFEYSAYRPNKEEPFSVVKIGKENWYLQWIKITLDNINTFTLKHQDLILYEYDSVIPFLKAEDHDLTKKINKDDLVFNVVNAFDSEESVISFTSRSDLGDTILYELDFNVRLDGKIKHNENLYLSGEFNDWAIGDERYKLVKNSDDIYYTKINHETSLSDVYYTITTKDGRSALDKEGNIEYFKYEFLNKSLEIEDYDIVKSYEISFNNYNYYKWITISVYVVVLMLLSISVYMINVSKSKKAKRNIKYTDVKPGSQQSNKNKQIEE